MSQFTALLEERHLLCRYRNLMVREQKFGNHSYLNIFIVALNDRMQAIETQLNDLVLGGQHAVREIFIWLEYSADTHRYLISEGQPDAAEVSA